MKKRMMGLAIAQTMMAMIAVTGCNTDNDSTSGNPIPVVSPVVLPSTLELTQAEKELVNHSNKFAFNLFRRAQDGLNSQVLSPISITYALGMLNNGADGETRKQINQVLGFGDTGADGINDFCYKMLKRALSLDPQTKALIANNIYLRKGFELKDDFIQKAKAFYNAEPEALDFLDDKTLYVINHWASDHTEQMIDKILDIIDPNAFCYLLNAIYFKGTWTYTFDKNLTCNEEFKHVGMTTEYLECPMMRQEAEFEYAEDDKYQAVCLPYGNGSFQMTVLLPKGDTNDLPIVPTAEEWQQLNEKMSTTHVYVKLPRFEIKTEINLKQIMTDLGMPDAFDAYKADFSNFSNVKTCISLMKQVAKIKVDEEGTEASAVTIEEISFAPISYTLFNANHPFIYVISERQSGAIFFIGQYTGYTWK